MVPRRFRNAFRMEFGDRRLPAGRGRRGRCPASRIGVPARRKARRHGEDGHRRDRNAEVLIGGARRECRNFLRHPGHRRGRGDQLPRNPGFPAPGTDHRRRHRLGHPSRNERQVIPGACTTARAGADVRPSVPGQVRQAACAGGEPGAGEAGRIRSARAMVRLRAGRGERR